MDTLIFMQLAYGLVKGDFIMGEEKERETNDDINEYGQSVIQDEEATIYLISIMNVCHQILKQQNMNIFYLN